MHFTIDNSSNFFQLTGNLNKTNAEAFENELGQALKSVDKLTINIENLDSIDRFGVKAFTNLHEQSIKENKELSIVGMGCKELYDHFKTQITTGNAA